MTVQKVKYIDHQKAILYALRQAKIANLKIIKLGLPMTVQRSLMLTASPISVIYKPKKPKFPTQIGTLFGIPVEISKTMQITTEISIFIPDK